jgi:hypothetical protein
MASFDPRDPFPFLPLGALSAAEEQSHALAADAWLGLDVAAVERELMFRGCRSRAPGASGEAQELWLGLAATSLLTPYIEIRRALQAAGAGPGATIVDLGAAYGRMGFVVARCFPGARFIGYEYAGERVAEGARALARFARASGAAPGAARLVGADLSAPGFAPGPADIYFIYDFGTPKAIEKCLHDLRRIGQVKSFLLIGRGQRCRDAISRRHGWLKSEAAAPGERALRYRASASSAARIEASSPRATMRDSIFCKCL